MNAGRRGIALIVALSLTALLALLATVFVVLAGTERRITRNHLDTVRARLAAESGVDAALALLQQRMLRGLLWTDSSWSVSEDRSVILDGVAVKDAGFLPAGAYGERGDLYRVRIADAQSRLHVNDGAPGGPDHSVSRNLRRILNILGAQPAVNVPGLGDKILRSRPSSGYASVFDVARAFDGDADAFARVRPFITVAAWSDPDVCNPVPLSAETAPLYGIPFDRPRVDGAPVYRYGHQKNFRGERIAAPLLFFDPRNADPAHPAVWGRDSLNPQWIEIVGRAPVNVNTAPREVLSALITDLEGFLLVERRRDLSPSGRGAASLSPCSSPGAAYSWTSLRYRYDGRDQSGNECGLLYRTVPFTGPGGRSRDGIPAAAVVDEILACRKRRPSPGVKGLDYAAVPFGGPFGGWAQFNLFVDALVEHLAELEQAGKDNAGLLSSLSGKPFTWEEAKAQLSTIEAVSLRERALLIVREIVALGRDIAAAVSAGDAASFARKDKEFTKTVEMLREADGVFRKAPSGGRYAALVDLNGSTIDDLVIEAAGYLQAAAGCIRCTPSSVSDFDDLGRKLMDRAAAFEVRIRTQP